MQIQLLYRTACISVLTNTHWYSPSTSKDHHSSWNYFRIVLFFVLNFPWCVLPEQADCHQFTAVQALISLNCHKHTITTGVSVVASALIFARTSAVLSPSISTDWCNHFDSCTQRRKTVETTAKCSDQQRWEPWEWTRGQCVSSPPPVGSRKWTVRSRQKTHNSSHISQCQLHWGKVEHFVSVCVRERDHSSTTDRSVQ